MVVDKGGNLWLGNTGLNVGIKDFEEIAKVFLLGLTSELLKLAQRLVFFVKVVGESDSFIIFRLAAAPWARSGVLCRAI